MAGRVSLPTLGPRARLVLRILGYIVLALVTFVFALQLTFPFDRVKAKVEEALSSKYDVTIGDVERGWIPGRVYFNSISLRTRPTKPDEVESTIFIDRLMVDMGILPLFGGAAAVKIDAAIGTGHVRGKVALSKDGISVDITGSNLQSQMLPMREVIGLPMSGVLDFSFDLDLPNEVGKTGKSAPNWQKAEGSAELACASGCTFGDGKTKLKTKLKNTRNQALVGDGIEFGKVNVTSMFAKVDIKNARLEVTKFDTKSDDGTLAVEYAMDLEPSFGESSVTGCLRFNVSQALLKRDAKTFTAITATGAPLGPDGQFHIRLTDKFKDMKRLGQLCGSGVSNKSMDNPGGTTRPTITVPAEEPPRDAGVAPTFNPPQMVPDAGADAAVNVPVPGPDMPGSASHDGQHGPGSAGAAAGAGAAGGPPAGEPARKH